MKIEFEGLFARQKLVMNSILFSTAKYHTINASRQSSKSFTLSRLAIMLGLTIENDKILVVSPTYEQVRIIFDNILSIGGIFAVVTKVTHSKPYEIELRSGTRISFKSADRPDTLRGGSYRYVLLDEFAFFKPGVFGEIIRPTTAAKKNSKIIAASTPKGKSNDFYDLAEQGMNEDNDNYEYHTMHYSDNPYYDQSEVADAKLRLPKSIFDQEYEAMFIDGGGDVFRDIDLVSLLEQDFYTNYRLITNTYAGIDWGRVGDDTVLTILNAKKEVILCKEYKGDWDVQIKALAVDLLKYKPITYAEGNGIGDPLISQLKKLYSNVQPFTMTNSSKKELVEDLILTIVLQEIKLPTKEVTPKLHKQLEDFTFSQTKTGLITYHHPDGEHDDYVDSLMIANHSFKKHNQSFINPIIGRRVGSIH